jgi:hypothetical protein
VRRAEASGSASGEGNLKKFNSLFNIFFCIVRIFL